MCLTRGNASLDYGPSALLWSLSWQGPKSRGLLISEDGRHAVQGGFDERRCCGFSVTVEVRGGRWDGICSCCRRRCCDYYWPARGRLGQRLCCVGNGKTTKTTTVLRWEMSPCLVLIRIRDHNRRCFWKKTPKKVFLGLLVKVHVHRAPILALHQPMCI